LLINKHGKQKLHHLIINISNYKLNIEKVNINIQLLLMFAASIVKGVFSVLSGLPQAAPITEKVNILSKFMFETYGIGVSADVPFTKSVAESTTSTDDTVAEGAVTMTDVAPIESTVEGAAAESTAESAAESVAAVTDTHIILRKVNNRGSHELSRYVSTECNGIVLKVEDTLVKVLSMPPMTPMRSFNINHVITDYYIYTLADATTVTLYYDTVWKMSTIRGIDVTNVKVNTRTFKELFEDACTHSGAGFDYSRLDKNKCYTIGFRHPSMHPLNVTNKYAVFQIQTFDIAKFNKYISELSDNFNRVRLTFVNFLREKFPEVFEKLPEEPLLAVSTDVVANPFVAYQECVAEFDDAIGILPQQSVNLALFPGPTRVRAETPLMKSVRIIKHIGQMNKSAVAKYLRSPTVAHFGFALRTRDYNRTQISSVVFLESDLFITIRDLIYDNKKFVNRFDNLCYTNHELCTAFSAYTNPNVTDTYFKLFPTQTGYKTTFANALKALSKKITERHADMTLHSDVTKLHEEFVLQTMGDSGNPVPHTDPHIDQIVLNWLTGYNKLNVILEACRLIK
jgi:hypothetical protein